MREYQNYRNTLAALRERFPGKDVLNGKELADYFGMTRQAVCTAIRNGDVPGRKVGKNFVVPLTQLAQWECEK